MPKYKLLWPVVGGRPISLKQKSSLGVLLAGCLFPFTLLAQTGSPGGDTQPGARSVLDEIIITAQRRQESLQDVAISVAAVTGDDLARQGITNFQDLDRAVAGLYTVSDEGWSSGSIRIRGVGTRGQSPIDPSVGVVVDGVFQPRVGSVFSDLMDIQTIEVLRGPQGTLFGKNTTAGLINIVTKAPDTREFSGTVQATAGNFNQTALRGSVNIPIMEDMLGMRLSGYSVQRDGINKNLVIGRDTRDESRQGLRARLLFTPVETLDVNLILESNERDAVADRQLASYGRFESQGPQGGRPLEDVAADHGIQLPPVGRFGNKVHENGLNRNKDAIDRVTLQVDWAIPRHTITSISAYEEIDARMFQDSDGTQLDLQRLRVFSTQDTLTQELRIASDLPVAGIMDYVFGLFYQKDEVESDVASIDGADAARFENRPQRPPTPVRSFIDTETYAVFGNVSFQITDQWRASIGARYTEVEKEQEQEIELAPGFVVNMIPLSDEKFSEATYTAQLMYQFDDNRMVYFSAGTGFKTGGFNRENPACFVSPLPCLTPEQRQYDKETTDNFELGWKTQWLDNRLRFNGAVFYQTFDDFQVTSSLPSAATVIVVNAAEVESYGVEMDFVATPTNNLLLNGSLAWINTEYDSYPDAPCSPTVSKSPACSQDLSGKRLDNAPRITGNLGAEYFDFLPGMGTVEWFVRSDVSYRDSTNLTDTQRPDTRQSSFALLNARAGFRGGDGGWKVEAWVDNLTDKDYGIVGHPPALHSDGLSLIRGMPRTYGLTTEFRF